MHVLEDPIAHFSFILYDLWPVPLFLKSNAKIVDLTLIVMLNLEYCEQKHQKRIPSQAPEPQPKTGAG